MSALQENNAYSQLISYSGKKMLLHTCCAPCSGAIIEVISKHNIDLTIFFYNPNIHPFPEYIIRKNEQKRHIDKLGLKFIDCDYDTENWFKAVKGFENEPERGARCTICFSMRLEKTALYAAKHRYPVFATSLGISRWKNIQQVNECGLKIARKYDVEYLQYNWRQDDGIKRMYEIARTEAFYKQLYCGCLYSLRDAKATGREKAKPSFYQ